MIHAVQKFSSYYLSFKVSFKALNSSNFHTILISDFQMAQVGVQSLSPLHPTDWWLCDYLHSSLQKTFTLFSWSPPPFLEHLCPLFIQIAQMGLILPRWGLSRRTLLLGICTNTKHPQPHYKTPLFLAWTWKWAKWTNVWAKWDPSGQFVRKMDKNLSGQKNLLILFSSPFLKMCRAPNGSLDYKTSVIHTMCQKMVELHTFPDIYKHH